MKFLSFFRLYGQTLNNIKTACETLKINDAKSALNELKQKAWPGKIYDFIDEISVHLLRGEYFNVAFVIDKVFDVVKR